MTPKEIVYRAIERRGPPRLPINYCNRDFDQSDTISVGYGPATDFVPREPGDTEWGFVWEVLDKTMGQPKTHPLADDAALDSYRPPDPHAPGRFDSIQQQIEAAGGRFIKFGLGITGFNHASFLRGYEQYMLDLRIDPDLALRITDMVFDFENGIIDQAVKHPVDAVTFGDDWGTQQGLMIAVEQWRELFKPRYAAQFERVRRAGKKVWFHSCGNVHSIIGDLIEIGADVIELLQPDVMGIERLAKDFGGRICFCCSIDHQRRAISGSREEIFAYARRLRDTLGAFNGGYIAYIEDYSCLGMDEQHYQWIRAAFHALNAERG